MLEIIIVVTSPNVISRSIVANAFSANYSYLAS